jgi:hypothetical protein
MKKYLLLGILLLGFFLLGGCCQPTGPEIPIPIEPGPAIEEPGTQVQPEPESNLEVLPRESKIPTDAVKMTPETDFYPPILHSDEFEEPVPMPYPINTAGAEDSAFITSDGNNFYVWSTPDPNIPVQEQLTDGVTGIYWSKKVNGQWGEPERMVLNDDLSLDGCLFVQGNEAWFCSARIGNYRGVDLWTAELVNGKWANWENAGEKINVEYQVGEMHITSDGNEMYFHSGNRSGGKGGYDIYSMEKVNGEWQQPTPVDAVNTVDMEGWPFISENGNELWFTRFYQGSPAIFRSERINGTWNEPELIVSQFAGESTFDEQGNLYFTHHFYENGTMIEADIYVAYKK